VIAVYGSTLTKRLLMRIVINFSVKKKKKKKKKKKNISGQPFVGGNGSTIEKRESSVGKPRWNTENIIVLSITTRYVSANAKP